jgi:hypothetical protein
MEGGSDVQMGGGIVSAGRPGMVRASTPSGEAGGLCVSGVSAAQAWNGPIRRSGVFGTIDVGRVGCLF